MFPRIFFVIKKPTTTTRLSDRSDNTAPQKAGNVSATPLGSGRHYFLFLTIYAPPRFRACFDLRGRVEWVDECVRRRLWNCIDDPTCNDVLCATCLLPLHSPWNVIDLYPQMWPKLDYWVDADYGFFIFCVRRHDAYRCREMKSKWLVAALKSIFKKIIIIIIFRYLSLTWVFFFLVIFLTGYH